MENVDLRQHPSEREGKRRREKCITIINFPNGVKGVEQKGIKAVALRRRKFSYRSICEDFSSLIFSPFFRNSHSQSRKYLHKKNKKSFFQMIFFSTKKFLKESVSWIRKKIEKNILKISRKGLKKPANERLCNFKFN